MSGGQGQGFSMGVRAVQFKNTHTHTPVHARTHIHTVHTHSINVDAQCSIPWYIKIHGLSFFVLLDRYRICISSAILLFSYFLPRNTSHIDNIYRRYCRSERFVIGCRFFLTASCLTIFWLDTIKYLYVIFFQLQGCGTLTYI